MSTITRRGNSFRIRVSCGYDINNKQIMKSLTWTPEPGMTPKQIEKALERQKVLFEEKCGTGQYLDGRIKFIDFQEKWFKDYAEKHLRPTTLLSYRQLIQRINATIGHLCLEKIQPHHLLSFYDNLSKENVRNDYTYKSIINFKHFLSEKKITIVKLTKDAKVSEYVVISLLKYRNVTKSSAEKISKALNIKMTELFEPVNSKAKLAPKMILHHHRLISKILNTAVEWQVILSNPCNRVKPPKSKRIEAKYLDEIEAALLLERLENENFQYHTMIKLLLYTGIRRGELCGLEWKDIDFDNQVMHIRRTSLYLPGKGIFVDDTKSMTSERSIKLPQSAIDILKEFNHYQEQQKLEVGDNWIDNDRLFTSWDGQPIHPHTISGWFRKFIYKNNLPSVSIHSLRHTNATLLIASGVPIKTVSHRLGHAQTSTTANIYAHAIRSAD
ncbi:MAG TPA: tyrosine-type recombinase/integrase, partial [Patescibacteria group bacterium]|nr:tyrosine-type recombinase/integrase [Patescibacteria group bacterium]